MRKRLLVLLAAVFLHASLVGVSQAELVTIGTASYNGGVYNLIYDADSPFGPITWLAFTNYESWQGQLDWAAGLNDSGVITYNLNSGVEMNWTGDWRLPHTVDGNYVFGYDGTTTGGYNITTSELGHLFYEGLGNIGFLDTNGDYVGDGNWGLKNTGDFDNLNYSNDWYYWSGTENVDTPCVAWEFDFYNGNQSVTFKNEWYFGLAVRPGKPVPIPGAFWLLGSGLAGLVSLRKRRQGNRR